MLMFVVQVIAFGLGAWLVLFTMLSAVRSFVMPRSQNAWLTRTVFMYADMVFTRIAERRGTFAERDRILAYLAPVTLVILPMVWLFLVMIGFMLMFWAIGVTPLYQAFALSGSSLLTLGFVTTTNLAELSLAFLEAIIGLVLVALLIAYIPTMYAAFARREAYVAKLEVRAGSPPSPVELIARLHRIGRIDHLEEMWVQWEDWFTELDESHTSLGPLNLYRSPSPDRSWITAAGVVLDATALFIAAVDLPASAHGRLCIRAGYIALRHIADFFRIPYNAAPKPDDPIAVTRQQFETALDELSAAGIPLKADRDQAWRDFAGWRVNYDVPLMRIAVFLTAPPARWIHD